MRATLEEPGARAALTCALDDLASSCVVPGGVAVIATAGGVLF